MVTLRMVDEVAVLQKVFSSHGVACVALPPPASFQTAALRVYRLQRGEGVTVNRVLALSDEIDEALTAAVGAPMKCRFDRPPLRLEVPRLDPQPLYLMPVLDSLQLLSKHFVSTSRVVCAIGESCGELAKTLLVDLVNPNSPHVLVAGTTGSGKSNLLLSMVISLVRLYTPSQVALVLLDPKGLDFRPLAGLPHLATPLVSEPVESVRTLAQVVQELERRKQTIRLTDTGDLPPGLPRLVVVIDELAELADVAGVQVEANIKRLLQVGRGLGIHVIAATQKPLASVIGSIVKANFPVRLVGKVTSSEDAKVAAGIPGTSAERLPGKGSFLLIQSGMVQRVQAYHLPYPHLRQQVERVSDMEKNHDLVTWRLPKPIMDGASLPTGNGDEVGSRSSRIFQVQPGATSPQWRGNDSLPTITPPNQSSTFPNWLAQTVADYVRQHQIPPSQKAVQRTYQQETGQMLNWEAIKAAISEGVVLAQQGATQP